MIVAFDDMSNEPTELSLEFSSYRINVSNCLVERIKASAPVISFIYVSEIIEINDHKYATAF